MPEKLAVTALRVNAAYPRSTALIGGTANVLQASAKTPIVHLGALPLFTENNAWEALCMRR